MSGGKCLAVEGCDLNVKVWIIAAILSIRLDNLFLEPNHVANSGMAAGGGTSR
jgi:hypothetical protein